MNRINEQQMAELLAAQREHFRRELCRLIEGRFGRPEPGGDQRSPEEVVGTALDFAGTVGATTDAQITRVAILLATVNRQRLAQDKVGQLRALLLQPEQAIDERLAQASAFLGLED